MINWLFFIIFNCVVIKCIWKKMKKIKRKFFGVFFLSCMIFINVWILLNILELFVYFVDLVFMLKNVL